MIRWFFLFLLFVINLNAQIITSTRKTVLNCESQITYGTITNSWLYYTTLSNNSNQSISISSYEGLAAPFSLGNTVVNLPAGATYQLAVYCYVYTAPNGSYIDTLLIYHSANNNPAKIILTATINLPNQELTFTLQPEDNSVNVGENAVFTAEFTGATHKGYQWWYDQNGLTYACTDGAMFSGSTTGTLTVLNSQSSYSGITFTCEAKNLDCYPNTGCWKNSNTVSLTVNNSNYEYDYIVDKNGGADFTSITQLNAATISSGSVVGFTTNQQFSDAILNCKSGVTYTTFGNGKATIGDSLSSAFTHSVQIDNKTNVVVDGLKIYGTNSSANYSTLSQYAAAASAVVITSSLLYASDTATASNKNLLIKNCEIIGGHNSTVNKKGQGIVAVGGIKGLTIENNVISYFAEGIQVVNPYTVLIKDNILHHIYWSEPRRNIFNAGLRGAEAIELYGEYANSTASWNSNYTVKISGNEIYDFETSAMVTTTISKVIIEKNKVHDNLDPKTYHGGIDHAHGLGKLDDYSFGVTRDFPGSVGTIVRWNKIYNIYRGTTSLNYPAHNGFRFQYNGTDYETDGSVNLWESYSIDPDYSPYSIGAVIDGSGYDMQIYGNLIYNCDRRGIIRTQKSSASDMTANTTYKNEIYNNTFWNVAYDPGLTDYGYNGGSIVGIVEKMPPTYVRNNIFYMTGSKGAALYIQYGTLYEGNNIFFVQSNVRTGGAGNANFNVPPDAIYISSTASRTILGSSSTFGVALSNAANYFIDYANGDFRLKSGSPAINNGADLGNDRQGLNKISGRDYTSGSVDIGAFEYVP